VKGETDKRMVVVALRGKRSKNTPSIQQEYTRKRTAAVAIGCQYPYHTTTEKSCGNTNSIPSNRTGKPCVFFLNVIADITKHTL